MMQERMLTEDGQLIIQKTQDVEAILDANKAEAETHRSGGNWRKAGSIPLVVAEEWAKECGAAVGSKEWLAYCKRKLMDGDFAKLRVRGY